MPRKPETEEQKIVRRAKAAIYRQNNREKIRERERLRRLTFTQEHKDMINLKSNQHYHKNKDRIRETARVKQSNLTKEEKEIQLQNQRQYQKDNKEKIKVGRDKWYIINKDRIKIKREIYREDNIEMIQQKAKEKYEESKINGTLIKYENMTEEQKNKQIKASMAYTLKNKEKVKEYQRLYRLKKKLEKLNK